MKNLFSTTALVFVLSISGAAFANTHGQGKEGIPSHLEETIAQLPQEDAAQFRDTMQEAHEKNMPLFDRVHALHNDLDSILTAETFDKDAFLAKSEKLQEVYEKMRNNTDEAFASAASQLSQEERKTLAAGMTYPHGKHQGSNKAQ